MDHMISEAVSVNSSRSGNSTVMVLYSSLKISNFQRMVSVFASAGIFKLTFGKRLKGLWVWL